MTHIKHTLLLTTACLACLGLCFLVYIGICANMKYSLLLYTIDPTFSENYALCLESHMNSFMQTSNPQQALNQLCNDHKAIASIQCAYKPSRKAHIKMHAHDPIYICNATHAVLHNGALVPEHAFDTSVTNTLPHVTIPEAYINEEMVPESMHTLISTLPVSLHHDYTITWHDTHALMLKHKDYTNVAFICDTEHAPDQDMLQACHTIAQEYRNNTRKQNWIIDTRFENQCIVYQDTRGYIHGSSVG